MSQHVPEQVLGVVEPGPGKPLGDVVHGRVGVHHGVGRDGADDLRHVPDLLPELVVVCHAPFVQLLVVGQMFTVFCIYQLSQFGQFVILNAKQFLLHTIPHNFSTT